MAIGAFAAASRVLAALEQPPLGRRFPVEGRPPAEYLDAAVAVGDGMDALLVIVCCLGSELLLPRGRVEARAALSPAFSRSLFLRPLLGLGISLKVSPVSEEPTLDALAPATLGLPPPCRRRALSVRGCMTPAPGSCGAAS